MSAPRPRSLAPWLALAALGHLLIWAMWGKAAWGDRVEQHRFESPAEALEDIEVEISSPSQRQAGDAVEDVSPLTGEVSGPRAAQANAPRPVDRAARGASVRRGSEVTNQPAQAGTPVPTVAPDARPDEPSALPSQSQASAGNRNSVVPKVPSVVPSADRLAALGYGAPNAAALKPLLNVSPVAMAEDRLNLHLAQAVIDEDRDHSLGIEGPVTKALHTGAMSVVVPKSLSKVAITIGRDGKIADFRIIETNRDARALKALGERVKRLLANQTVRVPSGRAMEFIYEVKSEVLLPSGHAPGLAVEVFGIPVKEGRDDKSSKISILTPHLEFKSQSQPDPDRNGKVTQTLPQLVYGISLLGIGADAVDIGAPERQVVHTRLIQQRVL